MVKKLKINTDRIVFILAVISMIWIVLYKIVFTEISEIFYHAEKASDLFYNICLSIISSAIFYYFVVYLERKRIQKIIVPSIQKKIIRIGLILDTILTSMYEINNKNKPNNFPDTLSFTKIFDTRIRLSSIPETNDFLTFIYTPNNWYDYFDNCFKEVKDCTDIIYSNVAYIPEEFVSLVNKIQKSHFEEQLNQFKNFEYKKEINNYQEMHLVAGFMYHYLADLKKLSEYQLK